MRFKEDERQRYNALRKAFMRKFHLKAGEVPGLLSKEQVRNLTADEIHDLATGVFTKKNAKLVKFKEKPEDTVTKASMTFEQKLLDIVNKKREALRQERANEMQISKQGEALGTTRGETLGERNKSYQPYSMVPQTSAERVRRGTRLLLGDVEDITHDDELKEKLIRAVMRSKIPYDDAVLICAKIRSMSSREVGELRYSEEDFDFSYIYDDSVDAGRGIIRAKNLKKILGITDDYNPRIPESVIKTWKSLELEGDWAKQERIRKHERNVALGLYLRKKK